MNADQLRKAFLDFMQRENHALISYAPLLPENDASVLFTTAGMHPLVPYLLGETHPAGKRLANYQKCLRTNDIDEVGDATHLTLFEMLGNWSIGAYWKEEALRLSYRLLTEVFGHDPARLHVTCFAGDDDAPRDEEAAAIWRSIGIPAERIHFLGKEDNWWGPAGATGPCGPDSEVFFDSQPAGPSDETPATNPGRFWELANNVFIQYDKQVDGSFQPLALRSIDVGVGLERNLMVLQGVDSVYDTDLFQPLMRAIGERARSHDLFAMRVIADHVRAASFVLAEGVRPGNSDQAYVVRRLIRRAVRYGRKLGIEGSFLADLSDPLIESLGDAYPELRANYDAIRKALREEEQRFQSSLARGEREFARVVEQARSRGQRELSGQSCFRLYDTFGFPIELTSELAAQEGLTVDRAGFEAAFAAHQAQSRQGAAARFAGGLAERNPITTKLHTATHLLQAALRLHLGEHVVQRGSNITSERLRFDFSHGERLSSEQLAQVEAWVNRQIEADLPVTWSEMSLQEARARGALGLFEERYGERVKVYAIGDVSIEVCGGPHVEHTGELGHFRIIKEEAVGAGVRRIKALLEAE
jgi:Alanyl-tRNA synthetase